MFYSNFAARHVDHVEGDYSRAGKTLQQQTGQSQSAVKHAVVGVGADSAHAETAGECGLYDMVYAACG